MSMGFSWQSGGDMDALSAKSEAMGKSGDIVGSGALTINAGMKDEEKVLLFFGGLVVFLLIRKKKRG